MSEEPVRLSDTAHDRSDMPLIEEQRPKVWCLTCEHAHIATIPVITYRCHVCGFGSWKKELADQHHGYREEMAGLLHLLHITYREGHVLVPLAERDGGSEDG